MCSYWNWDARLSSEQIAGPVKAVASERRPYLLPLIEVQCPWLFCIRSRGGAKYPTTSGRKRKLAPCYQDETKHLLSGAGRVASPRRPPSRIYLLSANQVFPLASNQDATKRVPTIRTQRSASLPEDLSPFFNHRKWEKKITRS